MKKKPLLVNLEKAQLEALKELKAKTGASLAYMIREAIDDYLASDKPVK